ncbi:MAG: hypothetical protein FJW24_01980 [Acidimicrobiia bacterium]|nr:hypothetical protein [Acidimicrobiia bacterium]
MRGHRYAWILLVSLATGLAAEPALAQFNPFSGVVSAIEAAAEDRSAADIAADAKIKAVSSRGSPIISVRKARCWASTFTRRR